MVESYSLGDIGREDGLSQVELTQVRVICNKCGVVYEDQESIEQTKKWIEEGYAPCPNITCPGELEIKGEDLARK